LFNLTPAILHIRTLNYFSQAGAFAAVTVDFIVYPFDTLKTRIQSPDYHKLYKDAATGAVRRNALYGGLYQGVWSVVLSTIPGCTFSLVRLA
jgi:hypothetical protein